MVNALAGLAAGIDASRDLQSTYDNSRLSMLAGRAYTAPQEQRQSLLGQMASISPQAAQAQQSQWQGDEDRQTKLLVNGARYMKGAIDSKNPNAVAGAWNSLRPAIIRAGLATEQELSPTWDPSYETTMHQLLGMGSPDASGASGVQSTYVNAQGKRMAIMRDGSQQELGDANQSIRVLEQEGAMPYGVVTSGGVAGQTVQLGAGQQQAQPQGAYIDPSLPPEVQAQIRQSIAAGQEPPGQMVFSGGPGGAGPVRTPTAGEKAAATERARLQAQQDFLPTELSMRTEADIAKSRGVEQAKSEQERASNERAKTAQLNNVDRGLTRIDEAMKKLTGGLIDTGPIDGRLMVSTPQGQELEAAVGAIQNDMLALTRVPGIGSQSDLEAKIANLKYPSIYNHPSVNAANVKQLREFMGDLRRQITGQAVPAPSSGQAAPAASDFSNLWN